MLKKHFVKAFGLAALALASLSSAHAELNQQQKDLLDFFRLPNYQIVAETSEYKIISTREAGLITFLGETTNFFQGSPVHFDPVLKQNFDPVATAFLAEVPKDKDAFITKKAKNEKYHAYVFYSSTCPHCRNVINDAAKGAYADFGISLTFIPIVNYRNPGEDLKISKVLELPEAKRFDAIVPTLDQMPEAKKRHLNLKVAQHYSDKYAIFEYPVFFFGKGLKVPGYQDAEGLYRLISSF